MGDSSSHRPTLRVLVLATSYPLNEDDNASVFLQYLYRHLGDHDIEAHVVVPALGRGGHQLQHGVHVHRFRYFFRPLQRLCYGSGILPNLKQNPALWLLVPFFLVAFTLAATRIAIRVRPSLIHGHWFIPTGIIGLIVSKLVRRPFVITAHGGDAFSMKSPAMRWLKTGVCRFADAWTANTETTARAVATEVDTKPGRILPMGIDCSLFSPASIDTNTSSMRSEYRLVFIGRLVEKKGVGYLLKALTLLPKAITEKVVLDVIGDGHEKERLLKMVSELNLSEKVNFLGPINNKELPQYLQRADLFIGPSIVDSLGDTEGQGVVFLEAMACKVCVVATAVGGIADVIETEESGILVPPADPQALANAIQELLEDGAKRGRLALNGYRLVREKYDWTTIASQFRALYLELIN